MINSKIYFIGAGPGDPDLITVKGLNIIKKADIIIYAGSLINIEVLRHAKNDCIKYDSSKLIHEEIIDIMKRGIADNKIVARVHTGDPSLYSTIREQIDELKKLNIDYQIIPGVSSFAAAAATLGAEFTLPEVSQSLIITRQRGRTDVPQNESIKHLASHKTSMILFLSVHMIDSVVEELKESYPPETPVAVVYKASWPEEKRIVATLSTIANKVKASGINKTALILVGNFLGDKFEKSKLYDKNFSHEYRNASK